VLAPQCSASLGILLHPLTNGHHRQLVTRDHPALDKLATHSHIGLPVLAVIPDPDSAAASQSHPARALDLQKDSLDRLIDPDELQAAPHQRTILDFGPCRAKPRTEIERLAVDRYLVAAMPSA